MRIRQTMNTLWVVCPVYFDVDSFLELKPRITDEFPFLFVAAGLAPGTPPHSGLDELRVKERDGLAAMAAALTGAGARVTEREDGLVIEGSAGEPLRGSANSRTKTHLDHRIAMSMAVAGLASRDGIEVDDTRPIGTSFPKLRVMRSSIARWVAVSAAGSTAIQPSTPHGPSEHSTGAPPRKLSIAAPP